MVKIKSLLLKFSNHGDKTGWTYLLVSSEQAQKLKPGFKKSFRVKGHIDDFYYEYSALIPYGGGDYLFVVNAAMRKAIQKKAGDKVVLSLELDEREFKYDDDFLECLEDEPLANGYFNKISKSHQQYFSKWISSAKTNTTKVKRIVLAINALKRKMGYPEMLREQKRIHSSDSIE